MIAAPITYDDITKVVDQTVARSEIECAMLTLSDDQKLLIAMVEIEGFTYEEAAETLAIPVGTVRSRLSRAKLKMADAITLKRIGEPK